MKIAFIIDQVYLHGGIERVLSIKANYLVSKEENEVFIITNEQKNNEPCYSFDKKIEFRDLQINYNRQKSYFHPINLFKLPKHIVRLRKTINTINPDIVVMCCHSTDTLFLPFINKKIPKVKEFHYSRFIEEKTRNRKGLVLKKLFYKLMDFAESRYDKLVILNKDEASYYKSNNTIVIPNPLTFYPETVSDVTHKKVIAAGRIAPVKGYDILIEVWKRIHPKHPDWKLEIYGSGEAFYIDTLQEKINVLDLQKSVSLMGATNNIKDKMLQSSIFAMTSHNECFPLVLLEAQACGLPIVSFDCPHGPRNIIDQNNGILVPLYDQVTFSSSLSDLMGDKEKRKKMSENARKNSMNYRLDDIMNQWMMMFEDCIQNKEYKHNEAKVKTRKL